jgi:uncharacterized protein (TIGR03435 family)
MATPTPQSRGGGGAEAGGLKLGKAHIADGAGHLEDWLHKPVIDETGVTNKFDIRLHWQMTNSELLPQTLGGRFFAVIEKPDAKAEEKLPSDQQRLLAAYRGKLDDAEEQKFSPENREALALLRAEMRKPEATRFDPGPAQVIEAVQEQWGLSLTIESRAMPAIVVEK